MAGWNGRSESRRPESPESIVRSVEPIVIETDRLFVRPWRASDLEEILEVYGDPDAMRFVGDGTILQREDAVTWLEVTESNYRRRGYGMCAVIRRDSGDVIGCAGLVHPGDQPECEIKYVLKRDHWNRGYASELVPAMVRYAREVHERDTVIATSDPRNLISHRVLEKSGLRRVGERVEDDGSITVIHAIEFGSPA
jgi:RimJ/RimL family protein N-acetyltransferase